MAYTGVLAVDKYEVKKALTNKKKYAMSDNGPLFFFFRGVGGLLLPFMCLRDR